MEWAFITWSEPRSETQSASKETAPSAARTPRTPTALSATSRSSPTLETTRQSKRTVSRTYSTIVCIIEGRVWTRPV